MAKPSKQDVQDATERLRTYLQLQEGKKRIIYQIVRRVSKSGMSRVISTFAVDDGQLVCLDWAIGTLVGGLDKREGVRIGGCGMDMGFALLDHAIHAAWYASGVLSDVPHGDRLSANDFDRRWL